MCRVLVFFFLLLLSFCLMFTFCASLCLTGSSNGLKDLRGMFCSLSLCRIDRVPGCRGLDARQTLQQVLWSTSPFHWHKYSSSLCLNCSSSWIFLLRDVQNHFSPIGEVLVSTTSCWENFFFSICYQNLIAPIAWSGFCLSSHQRVLCWTFSPSFHFQKINVCWQLSVAAASVPHLSSSSVCLE